MSISLGTIIKELRLKKGFSQQDLAKGICSSKQLSRIEHNQSHASTYILGELSYRLGENLLNYLPYADLKDPFLWKERIDQLEKLYRQEQYVQAYRQAKIYKEDPLILQSPFLHQRIFWYFGISACYSKAPEAYSTEDFLQLIKITHPFNEIAELWQYNLRPFEIRILNSAIFTLLHAKKYQEAEEWMRQTIKMFEHCYLDIKDFTYLKIFYNLSRLYYLQKKYEQCLEIANKGINLCKENNILYKIDDLCNIRGRCLYALGRKEEALVDFNVFLHLSSLLYENSDLDIAEMRQSLVKNYQILPSRYQEQDQQDTDKTYPK